MAQAPTPPPAQQRPPPMLTPDERAELHRRHQAQQQAQQAASPDASQPTHQAQAHRGEAPSPSATPGELDGSEKHDRKSGVQEALDRGRDPPIPEDLVNTGGVPGGSPSRPMAPPPEGAVVGNMGASAPEPVKTGPGNEQPSRQEPGPGA